MTREMELFHNYLKTSGLKRTSQRDLILRTFLELEEHVTPEELFNILRKKHSNIGFSTVYRTLKLFLGCGLAREMHRPDGTTVFEHKFEHPHHDHLLCNSCGEYFEFYNQNIEEIQKEIAAEHNFIMQGHRLEIFGLCHRCSSGILQKK